MLDLPSLKRIRLYRRPPGQLLFANTVLVSNFGFLPGVKIELQGLENLPDEPVILAMNHTDKYNYWPFQYRLYRETGRFTATWVKGKYYQNKMTAWFLQSTNNIPAASRGYLITSDFASALGRRPTEDEYAAARRWVDSVGQHAADPNTPIDVPAEGTLPDVLLTRGRDMMGRTFNPAREDYAHAIDDLFRQMTAEFVDLNGRAFEIGNDLLIFPQGTRSIRLSRGRIGLGQVALHFKRPVVPVGCSGSDLAYPGGSPFAKRGHITYRIGKPLFYEEFAEQHIPKPFVPFTSEAEAHYRPQFQAVVDRVMDRINELVDAPYQFDRERTSGGVQGTERFI